MNDLSTQDQVEKPEEAEIVANPYDVRSKMGKLIDLTEEQEKRLKKWLKKAIEDWKADTETLHKRLEEDNDLVEGVVYETSYPWDGASNVHDPLTETYMEIYRSVFKRSILGAEIIWIAESDEDGLEDQMQDVEEAVNWLARNKWDIDEAIDGVLWTTSRDGLGIVQATWSEEYEKKNDVVLVGTEEEFVAEFPSADDSGMSPEDYAELLTMVRVQASPDTPLEIPITFENRTYYGVKYDVVELIDFVTIPAWVPHIKDQACRGYGKRFSLHRESIKGKARDGVFYDDKVKLLLKNSGKSRTDTPFYISSDWVQGINRTNAKDEFELFELVVKGRLDGGSGEDGKYLVTYSTEHDILIQVTEYFYRVDFYALFKIDPRPNRLVGKSVPVKTRDLNDLVDTGINQRVNARAVYTIPTFKAHADLKNDPHFDPDAKENKFKPGRIFWSSKPELFDQFRIQPTDLGESLQEEQNTRTKLDLYLGSAASLLSGNTSPTDPNAPGNKTAMMIQQSNLRMDDPLNVLRLGMGELGDITVSHIYQFGPAMITYKSATDTPSGSTMASNVIPKKILRNGIRMKMRGVTVMQNPEAEMAKKMQLFQFLNTVPEFVQNPQARVELVRDILRSGRINRWQRFMPSVEQLQAQQVEMQKQAMMKMQQEQAAQAAQAKEQAVKDNLAKAHQDLNIKSTARKLAEDAFGSGEPPMEVPPIQGGM